MDPDICREHLEQLLGEEIAALSQLESLLDREHELLAANDVEQLDRAAQARQSCVGDLVRIEDERHSLCRMMNMSTDLPGLERLLDWCDPAHELRGRFAECAELAIRCRHLNDRNGALVGARLRKIEGMLGVLTGRAGEPKVYGKQGIFEAPVRGAGVLATA